MQSRAMSPLSSFLSRLRPSHKSSYERLTDRGSHGQEDGKSVSTVRTKGSGAYSQYPTWKPNLELPPQLDGRQIPTPHISDIPIDVLREIFVHCLPSTHNPLISQHEHPLLLTRVCSDWRDTALMTPRLWRSIHIPIPSFTQRDPVIRGNSSNHHQELIVDRFIELILAWLHRSGSCPLRISISNEYRVDPGVGYFRNLIKAVMSMSSRWQHVTIAGTSPDVGYILQALHGRKLPWLETLSISLFKATTFELGRVNWTKLNGQFNAPLLRKVDFLWVGGDYSKFPVDFSRLTHLSHEGGTMFAAGIGIILSMCPNLISCRVDIETKGQIGETLPQYNRRVKLPSLKRFSIREWDHDLSHLFTLIDAPSLVEFEYRRNNSPSTRCTCLPLLGQAVINTFITDGRLLAETHLLELLKHTPHLKELYIRPSSAPLIKDPPSNATNFGDSFLTKLSTSVSGQRVYLCAELEIFECHVGAAFSDRFLLEFIRRRRKESGLSTKLERISITFYRNPTGVMFNRLPRFIEEGLVAGIKYAKPAFDLTFEPHAGVLLANVNPHPF